MAKTSEFDPIDFLVARKYNLIQGMGVGSPPRSAEAEAQRREARRKYEKLAAECRLELSQKSRAELDALVEAARTEDREWLAAKQEKDESARPFNRTSAVATVPTYTYWAKLAFWSVDEAVALLLERNPKPVTWEMVKPHVRNSPFARRFSELREMMRRAAIAKQLSFLKNAPGFLLAWARRNQIDVPAGLESAVSALGIQVADWKLLYEKAKRERDEARQAIDESIDVRDHRIAELEARIANTAKTDLGTRERETLLKILIGLAIDSYQHDVNARRTRTASEMASDLARVGVHLDEDTIRKYLKMAAEFAPRDPTE